MIGVVRKVIRHFVRQKPRRVILCVSERRCAVHHVHVATKRSNHAQHCSGRVHVSRTDLDKKLEATAFNLRSSRCWILARFEIKAVLTKPGVCHQRRVWGVRMNFLPLLQMIVFQDLLWVANRNLSLIGVKVVPLHESVHTRSAPILSTVILDRRSRSPSRDHCQVLHWDAVHLVLETVLRSAARKLHVTMDESSCGGGVVVRKL